MRCVRARFDDDEREAVLELRRTGVMNDAWLRISQDLDLEDEPLDS